MERETEREATTETLLYRFRDLAKEHPEVTRELIWQAFDYGWQAAQHKATVAVRVALTAIAGKL